MTALPAIFILLIIGGHLALAWGIISKASGYTSLAMRFDILVYTMGRLAIIVLAFKAPRALRAGAFTIVGWNSHVPRFATRTSLRM